MDQRSFEVCFDYQDTLIKSIYSIDSNIDKHVSENIDTVKAIYNILPSQQLKRYLEIGIDSQLLKKLMNNNLSFNQNIDLVTRTKNSDKSFDAFYTAYDRLLSSNIMSYQA